MPTNYPGDPTATEAPSVAPDEDDVPTVALPADGDNENAATWAQPTKVLADWIAWLKKPFAKASAWAQRIQIWQNARKQNRFLVDHLGYSGGRIGGWLEQWLNQDGQNTNGTSTFTHNWVKLWTATVVNTGGTGRAATQTVADSGVPSSKLTNVLLLQVAGAAGDASQVTANPEGIFSTANALMIEFDIWPGATSPATHAYLLGFNGGSPSMPPVAGFTGAAFYTSGAGGNWFAICGDGAGITVVDTGVAVAGASWQTMRIEWLGSGVADDTTNACRFYISGTLKATIVANLPTGAAAAYFFGAQKVSGSAVLASFIGVVRAGSNF